MDATELVALRQLYADPGWIVQHASDNGLYVENFEGVSWADAPIPRRWHHCTPQTRGRTSTGRSIQRCACGAVWISGAWIHKNARRRNGRH